MVESETDEKTPSLKFTRDPTTRRVLSEDPLEHLKNIPVTTVKPNPNATQEAIEELDNSRGKIIDLYSERMSQAAAGQIEALKGAELESADSLKAAISQDPLDLYSSRMLKRKR